MRIAVFLIWFIRLVGRSGQAGSAMEVPLSRRMMLAKKSTAVRLQQIRVRAGAEGRLGRTFNRPWAPQAHQGMVTAALRSVFAQGNAPCQMMSFADHHSTTLYNINSAMITNKPHYSSSTSRRSLPAVLLLPSNT